MKMVKDKIVKDIPENLVPTYITIGWAIYEDKAPKTFKPKFVMNNDFDDTKDAN